MSVWIGGIGKRIVWGVEEVKWSLCREFKGIFFLYELNFEIKRWGDIRIKIEILIFWSNYRKVCLRSEWVWRFCVIF